MSYGIVHPRIPGFGWFPDEPLRIHTGPSLLERLTAFVKVRLAARRTARLELLQGRLDSRAETASRRVA